MIPTCYCVFNNAIELWFWHNNVLAAKLVEQFGSRVVAVRIADLVKELVAG
ncbi:hypothetical protein UFOVP1208_6 [uncultured Caudovirales phage]|uniref:Uncharacterized protein n=1 Tax=uncultured Caudovirales phage TaxID=2100421 RepID=A0A6J5RD48_9CAUD|nr:hypothetical protein UFOVP980_17 [uncultured Caudovirales phage]CAB4189494.1 hypothetical protein UFOVP1208_6 [uncultured Caudovirales phage]CAB4194107.1 hypothetical protein UFOVP1263_15 [uncultured Caudovirales phage]